MVGEAEVALTVFLKFVQTSKSHRSLTEDVVFTVDLQQDTGEAAT